MLAPMMTPSDWLRGSSARRRRSRPGSPSSPRTTARPRSRRRRPPRRAAGARSAALAPCAVSFAGDRLQARGQPFKAEQEQRQPAGQPGREGPQVDGQGGGRQGSSAVRPVACERTVARRSALRPDRAPAIPGDGPRAAAPSSRHPASTSTPRISRASRRSSGSRGGGSVSTPAPRPSTRWPIAPDPRHLLRFRRHEVPRRPARRGVRDHLVDSPPRSPRGAGGCGSLPARASSA